MNQIAPLSSRPPAETHIMVGLSGGVDSSVAALLLKRRGYQVTGLFMKNWEEDDSDSHCAAARDLEDVEAVCTELAIPLETANFSAEYWDNVFEHFLAEYAAGRTPNPDVLCNREIKFAAFLDHARDLGADGIATGHYAGIASSPASLSLIKAADQHKDQTYFLHSLNQVQLAATLFPLATLRKTEVRRIASAARLNTATKKDSTGLCFIGERPFREFLARFLPAQPGEIVDETGSLIGEHQGVVYYTIGQRQGLGIGGLRNSNGEPWFVADKDVARNRLVAVQGHDHPRLLANSLNAEQMHWIAGQPPATSFEATAKSRYRQPAQPCRVSVSADGAKTTVVFETPQRALTPGQSVVIYSGEHCLGGGVIEASSTT
ncbi:MAG: tRNA 2-thiouridine(34) synthase MnmA [Gammaproteobacteria bacterium]|nr:tRNA 2-thiouridine(34) synthase MnmA [Gammaproteobacteria bacterium]